MKKNMKRLVAIIALAAIAALIIAYVVSAFLADSGEAGNRFFGLFFGIIAIPILAWLIMFCIERLPDRKNSDNSDESK